MTIENKPTGAVALAFAAALLAAPLASNAMPTDDPGQRTASGAISDEIQPSPAALQHLEQTASTMIWALPIPPRWIELWPEVTHVESFPPRRP
jgi:hypothetical protein